MRLYKMSMKNEASSLLFIACVPNRDTADPEYEISPIASGLDYVDDRVAMSP